MNVTTKELNSDVQQLNEAILGSTSKYFHEPASYIGLPSSTELSDRLRRSEVRSKLENHIGGRVCRFFQVFMIKAELNLMFAGAEIVLTMVVMLACKFACISNIHRYDKSTYLCMSHKPIIYFWFLHAHQQQQPFKHYF